MKKRSLELYDVLTAASHKNNYPTDHVLKNLVAESNSEQIQLLSAHIRYWQKIGKWTDIPALETVYTQVADGKDLAICLGWLLNHNSTPKLTVFLSACGAFDPEPSYSANDLCRAFFGLCQVKHTEHSNQGIKNLSTALHSIEKYWGNEGVREALGCIELVHSYPKITFKSLDTFSPNIQQCLLKKTKAEKNIFNAQTIKALQANPYRHPHTPQSLELDNYFEKRFKPWLEDDKEDNEGYGQIRDYKVEKQEALSKVRAVLNQSKYKSYVKNYLRKKEWTEDFFWIRFEWCFLASKKKLSFIKSLNEFDRKTLWERFSDDYIVDLFRRSSPKALPYFFNNGYFKKSWVLELLTKSPCLKSPGLNYYHSFRPNSSNASNANIEDYLYASLDKHDLTYILGRNNNRLFNLDPKVYKTKAFSEFVKETFLKANKSLSFPHEKFLVLLLLFGQPPQIKEALHLTDDSGAYFWENAIRKNRYRRRYREIILKHAPDLIDRYNSIEDLAALDRKGFKAALKSVLSGKNTPSELQVREGSYPYFIPYIRKAFEKHPLKSAAYELALRFSIRDAAYLNYLCTLRYDNRDRIKPGHQFDALYQTHEIPKKSGGKRLITAPEARLKRLQKKILRKGFELMDVHDCAHGFRQGRSILTNAEAHVGKQCVVNVDISSFFPSTSYQSILKVCTLLFDGGLTPHARYLLADICSYAGGLPMGAPTSPAIANLVMHSADQSIAKACLKNGIHYTRYADDLTFSGNDHPAAVLPFVEKVIKQLGYELDPKKTNIFRRGRRQMVTGLVVNDKPNLPRRIRKQIRAAVHHKLHGKEIHWNGRPMSEESLIGHINCLKMVQPEEASRHKLILENKR